jgi:hypothetical protein
MEKCFPPTYHLTIFAKKHHLNGKCPVSTPIKLAHLFSSHITDKTSTCEESGMAIDAYL